MFEIYYSDPLYINLLKYILQLIAHIKRMKLDMLDNVVQFAHWKMELLSKLKNINNFIVKPLY